MMTEMTIKQASQYFGVSSRTIFRKIKKGELLTKKVGGKVIILLSDNVDIDNNDINRDIVADNIVNNDTAINELKLEIAKLEFVVEQQQDQISFYKDQVRLLQLHLVASERKGFIDRILGLFRPNKQLPTMKEVRL